MKLTYEWCNNKTIKCGSIKNHLDRFFILLQYWRVEEKQFLGLRAKLKRKNGTLVAFCCPYPHIFARLSRSVKVLNVLDTVWSWFIHDRSLFNIILLYSFSFFSIVPSLLKIVTIFQFINCLATSVVVRCLVWCSAKWYFELLWALVKLGAIWSHYSEHRSIAQYKFTTIYVDRVNII